MAGTEQGRMSIPEQGQKPEFVDSAGRPTDSAPGPRGQRMMQLGILTRAQKKKPVLPNIRTNADGQPDPNDMENAKLQSSLAQKAHERLMQIQGNGVTNTLSEQDPMQKSLVTRTPMMKR